MDVTKQDPVSLGNLARGAAIERFDDELTRVLENILDPNTGEGNREVSLRVKIKPAEDRCSANVQVFCQCKLAPPRVEKSLVYIGRGAAGAVAFEHNSKQIHLPIPTPAAPKVVGREE